MTLSLKIFESTLKKIKTDLTRPHDFAKERVGFLYGRYSGSLFVETDYQPVSDEHYEPTEDPVCFISGDAIRTVMERLYKSKESVFHVHEHIWPGQEKLSRTDEKEIPRLLQSFQAVAKGPHGIILITPFKVHGWCFKEGNLESMSLTIVEHPIQKECV